MHAQGILKTDDLITRFFRLCTEMCVDLCYRALLEQSTSPQTSQTMTRQKCFYTLDAFVRLIALLVKHSGDTGNTVTKINLLNKVSSDCQSFSNDYNHGLISLCHCILHTFLFIHVIPPSSSGRLQEMSNKID